MIYQLLRHKTAPKEGHLYLGDGPSWYPSQRRKEAAYVAMVKTYQLSVIMNLRWQPPAYVTMVTTYPIRSSWSWSDSHQDMWPCDPQNGWTQTGRPIARITYGIFWRLLLVWCLKLQLWWRACAGRTRTGPYQQQTRLWRQRTDNDGCWSEALSWEINLKSSYNHTSTTLRKMALDKACISWITPLSLSQYCNTEVLVMDAILIRDIKSGQTPSLEY